MRVLTLWEPWATLMALGEKRIETRSWSTKYRGPLAIHAAKGGMNVGQKEDWCGRQFFREALAGEVMYPGYIVAVVRLFDCYPTEKILAEADLSERELAFGNYEPGRFGWATDLCFRLPAPILHKGGQGLRILPAHVIEQIKAQGWSE